MDYQKPVRDQRVVSMTTASVDLCLYDPQETNYAKYYRLRRQKENERHQSRSEKLRENPCGQKAPIQQIDYCCSNNRSHRFTWVFQICILKRENLTLNVDNKETTAVMSSWCHHDVFVFYSFLLITFHFFNHFSMKEKTVLFPKIFEFIHTVVFVILLFF